MNKEEEEFDEHRVVTVDLSLPCCLRNDTGRGAQNARVEVDDVVVEVVVVQGVGSFSLCM